MLYRRQNEVFPSVNLLANEGHLTQSGYTETTHPPLGKLLIALSIRIFGDNPWAWRLPSLVCGGLATALSGYIAFVLSGRLSMFWLVAAILSLDGLWITQARVGLLNAPMVLFIFGSLALWLKGRATGGNNVWYMVLAGVSAGLAMGCKWQGALVILVPIVFKVFSVQNRRLPDAVPVLGAIIAAIIAYFATFIIIPFIHGYSWMDIFNLQAKIPQHHLHLDGVHQRYASDWYTWPFLLRPIWYGFSRHFPELPENWQTIDGILCIGNPAVFMLIIPALIWMIWRVYKHADVVCAFALAGFLTFWLPSAVAGRYTMFHHFYPALPFIAIGIASGLDALIKRSLNGKLLVVLIFLIILLAYQFFFPLWTGLTITNPPIINTFGLNHGDRTTVIKLVVSMPHAC